MNNENEKSGLMNASEFLKRIKKENLSGNEFLQLLANSKIRNSEYLLIESNPELTYRELVDILEGSNLTPDDFNKLLDIAHRRNEKKSEALRKISEAELAVEINKRSRQTAQQKDLQKKAPSFITNNFITATTEHSIEELEKAEEERRLTSEQAETENDETDETEEPAKIDAEQLEAKFFDNDAKKENRIMIAICAVIAVFLIIISFGIRYINTGNLLPELTLGDSTQQDVKGSNAENKEEILNVLTSLENSGAVKREEISLLSNLISENNTEKSGIILNCDKYIYYSYKNNVYVISTDDGKMTLEDTIVPKNGFELKNMLLCGDKIALIYEETDCRNKYTYQKEVNVDGKNTKVDTDIVINKAYTTAFIYKAGKTEPDNTYSQSGSYINACAEDNVLYLSTLDRTNEIISSVEESYLPSYIINGKKTYIENNLFVPASSKNACVNILSATDTETMKPVIKASTGGSSTFTVFKDKVCYIISDDGKDTDILSYQMDFKLEYLVEYRVKGIVECGEFILLNDSSLIIISNDNGYAVTKFNSSGASLGTVSKITLQTLKSVAADDATVYLIADKTYAVDISGVPKIIDYDKNDITGCFYKWNDKLTIALSPINDEKGNKTGLELIMYDLSNKQEKVSEREISRTAAEGSVLTSEAETDRDSVFVSEENNIIAVPVSYFDGISNVQELLVYRYSDDTGFTLSGQVSLYDQQLSGVRAFILENELYIIWGNRIISADTEVIEINTNICLDNKVAD